MATKKRRRSAVLPLNPPRRSSCTLHCSILRRGKRLAAKVNIQEAHNVIFLGTTGNGKTCIASALGMAARMVSLTVRYVRLPDILTELAIARGDGSYRGS